MVYGIGYIEKIKITSDIKPYYQRWKNMISRCYNAKDVSYKKYGARGVCVSEGWLCFDNFYSDIKLLKGWDEQKFLNSEIQLDKDKKIKEIYYIPKTLACGYLMKKIAN